MRSKLLLIGLVVALTAVVAPPAAEAAQFELLAGYYFPEEGDEDLTYGLRFGSRFGSTGSFGWMIQGSWFDVEDTQGASDVSALNIDLFHIDGSFMWYPGGGNFALFTGPGWSTLDIRISIPGEDNDFDDSDDVFTWHGGLAYQWNIGQAFLVKVDGRFRWYEIDNAGPSDLSDQLDYEASLAVGWRFGRDAG